MSHLPLTKWNVSHSCSQILTLIYAIVIATIHSPLYLLTNPIQLPTLAPLVSMVPDGFSQQYGVCANLTLLSCTSHLLIFFCHFSSRSLYRTGNQRIPDRNLLISLFASISSFVHPACESNESSKPFQNNVPCWFFLPRLELSHDASRCGRF
jgi:hypothetical protein